MVQQSHIWYNTAICGTTPSYVVQHTHIWYTQLYMVNADIWYNTDMYGTTLSYVVQPCHVRTVQHSH